tara:strand:- start:480 stop:956 length:477 start_codon:yes stop_codon:yes gene_type:complete
MPNGIKYLYQKGSIPLHVLILIIFIVFIVVRGKEVSRLTNFKKGIVISLIFSTGISTYFYSYFKWVNPTYLIEKKEALMALTNEDELLLIAEEKIKNDPEYYHGKSAQDLVEMQQVNIEEMYKPGKIVPLYLMIFTISGMLFSLIISSLHFYYLKRVT